MRDNFIFYKSFYDSISRIKNKELKADIFEAICELALNNNDIELDDEVGLMIMDLIAPVIKANNKRYEDGKKGGRPVKKTSGYSDIKTSGYENEKPVGGKNKKPNKEVRSKKKEEEEEVEVEDRSKKIEVYFQNQDLENIFKEFLQIRKKLKAVNSERAIKMLLNKLNNYDDETKYKMIEQSIVHSWKDIYELKEDKKSYKELKFEKEMKEIDDYFAEREKKENENRTS